MQEAQRPQRPAAVYVIPEDAHFQLVELQQHLRLLGRLAEDGHAMSPRATWWFKRLGREVGRILKKTYWSSEVQAREAR